MSLERSIKLIIDHLPLLQRPWAYLHRNLSGKYRVIGIGGNTSCFEILKTRTGANRNFSDGIYIDFQEPMRVELIETSVDVADFYFPNGGFRDKTFELLSMISDNRKQGDASAYLAPAAELPSSETEGKGLLDVTGKAWTNLPPAFPDYVPRPILEDELHQALKDDRHPVVTLVGRGDVGKTSLAVAAVYRVAQEGLFEVIVLVQCEGHRSSS